MARKKGERPSVETRERILTASLDLFALRGYEGTGINEIALRAGIVKSVIYYHFKNKHAILSELYASCVKQLFELKRGVLDCLSSSRSLEGALEGIADAFISFAMSHRRVIKVLLLESIKDGDTVPLLDFWDENVSLGAGFAREHGIDISPGAAGGASLEAFFLMLLPILGFAVLEEKWGKRYRRDRAGMVRAFQDVLTTNLREFWVDRLALSGKAGVARPTAGSSRARRDGKA